MSARAGLVLGGGGLLGTAWHAGVLTALLETHGWDARTAEVVVGTSAGAVTAANLRAGVAPPDLAAGALGRPASPHTRVMQPLPHTSADHAVGAAKARPDYQRGRLWQELARRPWATRRGLLVTALLPAGRLPNDDVVRLGDALFPDGWPQAPLWLPAVRLPGLARVVFGRDDAPAATVGRAVAASSAVPGLFTPVEVDGSAYVDGGAHSPTNLDLVAGLGLDVVIVSAPMSHQGEPPRDRRGWSTYRAARRYVEREAAQVRQAGTRVVLLEPSREERAVMGGDLMAADRLGIVAAAAYGATQRMLGQAHVRENLEPISAG